MKYSLIVLVGITIFIMSLCTKINATYVKPCLKCLKVYLSCQSEVHTLSVSDQKISRDCEDTYYECFHKNQCMRGDAQ